MTRGQQIIEEVKRIIAEAHKKGDNDPMADVVVTLSFTLGARWADRTMIEKACEWLYEYNRKQADKMFGTVHTADVTINVAEFRKAMESSSSEKPNNSKKGGEE